MYTGEPQAPSPRHPKADPFDVMRQMNAAQERIRRSCRILIGSLAVGTTVMLAPATVIGIDIHNTKEALSHTQPIIHDVAAPLDPLSDSMNFFVDGFATKNGSWNATFQVNTIQDIDPGAVNAIEYDNDGIDIGTIAAAIAEKVASQETTHEKPHVSLYGYSVGGRVTAKVMKVLYEKYGIVTRNATFDHTPVDASSVRRARREDGEGKIGYINVFHAVGVEIEYSSIARDILDRLYPNEIGYISSGLPLLRDQYLAAVTGSIVDDLSYLKDIPEEDRPRIISITSKDPTSDHTVDVAHSDAVLEEFTRANKLTFVSIAVGDIEHARLDLSKEQYADAMSQEKQLLAITDPSNEEPRDASDSLYSSNNASRQQNDEE